MNVTIDMKVTWSAFEPKPRNSINISKGESIVMSFLVAYPGSAVRRGISDPSIVVMDGSQPYEVCAEDFSLTFGKGMKAFLWDPALATAPASRRSLLGNDGDGTNGDKPAGATPAAAAAGPPPPVPSHFWFTLDKGRPVGDAAWLSTDSVMTDASGTPSTLTIGSSVETTEGVPLVLHGAHAVGTFRPSKFMAFFSLHFKRGTLPSLDLKKAFGTYSADALDSADLYITRDWVSNTILKAKFTSMTIGPGE